MWRTFPDKTGNIKNKESDKHQSSHAERDYGNPAIIAQSYIETFILITSMTQRFQF